MCEYTCKILFAFGLFFSWTSANINGFLLIPCTFITTTPFMLSINGLFRVLIWTPKRLFFLCFFFFNFPGDILPWSDCYAGIGRVWSMFTIFANAFCLNTFRIIDGWWTDDLRFYVLFNSISVISWRWEVDNERLCAMETYLRLRRFCLKQGSTSGPLDQHGQRWTHWATGAPSRIINMK